MYGFFLGYLNVEAYVYATATAIVALPWSFKFFFGAARIPPMQYTTPLIFFGIYLFQNQKCFYFVK